MYFLPQGIHKPLGFWAKLENQRQFLNELAGKFQIKNPNEWGRITKYEFTSQGGSSLLNHYDNSIIKTLKHVYPGTII